MVQIKKRDGRIVPFDKNKIIEAIFAAFKSIDGELSEYAYIKAGNIADYIQQQAEQWNEKDKYLTVEEIQDLVEKGLMSTKRKDIARAYVIYRDKRTIIRRKNSKYMRTIAEKINASNIQNQNANVDELSFGGRKGEASNELLKQYALDYCMTEKSRNNHLNNEIYIHDLDNYAIGTHNCLTCPLDPLLANGFNTKQTDIRPANSINTAFQLVAVIFQIQSLQMFGGVSANHLDWTMVPYVRKTFFKHFLEGLKYTEQIDYTVTNNKDSNSYKNTDCKSLAPYNNCKKILYTSKDIFFTDNMSIEDEKYTNIYPKAYKYALDMTKKELNQAAEGLFHNLNSLQSRSGNQLPFSSINFGTCTLKEGRMIIKALLESSLNGIGKLHRTPIFPCSIFQYMKGVNDKPGTPNYDLYRLALQSTAKRLYPNYANCDWSGNVGYDINDPRTYFSTMGCRTANGFDINGFGQLKDGRGNICPVTIILPTLAMEAKEQNQKDIIETFFQILDEKIYEAKDMLIERFNFICSQPMESAKFMYENGTMVGYIPEEGIKSGLKHGTLAVG